jgi:carotenoid cleavage dioxygenase-like enzyme
MELAGMPREQYETFPFFSFHHVNAYEVPDRGLVVVDTCAAAGIDFSRSKIPHKSDLGYYKLVVALMSLPFNVC